jgi:type II secretory pathway predicted ATPase ExeA
VSDPHAKHWLADDPNILASLNDLDRGLAGDGDVGDGELAPSVAPPQSVGAAGPPAPPARPLTSPAPASPAASIAPARPVPSPAPVRFVPPEPFGDADDDASAPPLAFPRPSAPAEPRVRRPLLDLFPPSALEAERPPLPTLGTAVGPQLPPPRPRPAPKPESDSPSQLDALTYEMFYGLREKAFSLSTDPNFLYQSASHDRAGQELLSAIRKRNGVAVLTGPLGTGKTTLCRSLVQEIDRRTVPSLVLEPLQSIDDLLKTMLVDFGVISRDDLAGAPPIAREVLTSTLTSFLESLVPLQASAVVIIDEAQNLPVTLLEEIGALLVAGPEARLLQVVLVGQPALRSLLKRSELRLLNARVARQTELGPLGADEISGYVMHRLSIAGANTRIEFNDAAVAHLYKLSAGVPRVVNLLCDRAMTRGQQSSAAVIDGALIEAAAADLDFDAPASDRPGVLGSLLLVVAFVLLVLAGAAGALWVSRDAVNRAILQWQNIPVAPGGPIRRLPVPIAPIPPPAEIPDNLQPDPAI